MERILTPEQMKRADAHAIRTLRIPSLRLMERAGTAAAEEIIRRRGSGGQRAMIVCGKGNNGGDGFVIARRLQRAGWNITVILAEHEETLSGDAQVNFQRLTKCRIVHVSSSVLRRLSAETFEVIVDAMLGTSFSGELRGPYRDAVRWCNRQSGLKVAVDIPTGLNGETGEASGDVFRADLTITISNPKTGFYRGRAKEYTGEVVVVPIGIPLNSQPKSSIMLMTERDVRTSIPPRPSNSHKHSVGKIFLLAGSHGMTGAALLCAQSAMRSGAGQVILGIPESEYEIVAKRTLEVMPLGLPGTRDGSISLLASGEIDHRMAWADTVLIGPGLSRNDETRHLILDVIRSCPVPLVVDADALNALAGSLDVLKRRGRRPVVLTPHHGEFSRLTGIPAAEIAADPWQVASAFAQRHHVVLVLKGAPSIVATPDGVVTVNPTGNPGMSTAGSGDLLAGIIASLIGQGASAADAARSGVFLHGAAGDRAAQRLGIRSMIAGDMIGELPALLKGLIPR